MCDCESVKILFSVQDRCREGRYLQGQAQPYVTTGNVETSVICHNWLSNVSVRACASDQTSHGRTGLLHNYRTPVEVILTKILFTQRRGWSVAEPSKKLLTQTTCKRFQHETLREKVEIMTLHLATSVMFQKVLCFIYGEDSFYIKRVKNVNY